MGKINKKITRKLSSTFQANKFKCEPMNDSKPESKPASTPEFKVVDNDSAAENDDKKKKKKPLRVKNDQVSKPKEPKAKRNSNFYMKCAKAREEKGQVILPAKIETKIYKLKKALQKKGLEGEEIRDIIRKKRREEELKMRYDFKHLCFKCRLPGHSLASCPQASEADSSEICYFCGSAEHRLHECIKYKLSGKKEQDLPYAKCFICKKSGHLTRSCKLNENGIFPKGGKCILCGSVNHMVKDCSKNKDNEKPEKEIILKKYGDVSQSIDADDFEITLPTKATGKSSRTVKF